LEGGQSVKDKRKQEKMGPRKQELDKHSTERAQSHGHKLQDSRIITQKSVEIGKEREKGWLCD
jgi:hypothetical protein